MSDVQASKPSAMQSPAAIYRWGKAKREPKFRQVDGGIELIAAPHTFYRYSPIKRAWLAVRAVRRVG